MNEHIFITTNLLLTLHELEQQFTSLGRGVVEQSRFILNRSGMCREMGRASGFFASAQMVADQIKKLVR